MFDVSTIAPNLRIGHDGIWYAADRQAVSYPPLGHQACFQVEDSSFWFKHRNACIVAAVKRFPPSGRGPIFDIGGGNGFVSAGLAQAGFDTALVEPGTAGAANAKRRGIATVVCATTADAGFRPSTLAAIGLFDVIEHIEDDLGFVAAMRQLLEPGGRVYATVPAYPALWSRRDETSGHWRRYTCASAGALFERAELKLDYVTYIFRPLPLPILLFRALPYRLGLARLLSGETGAPRSHALRSRAVARAVDALLGGEVRNIARQQRMPFGGSCLLVASAA